MKRTIILLSALFGLVFSAAAYEKGDARFTQKDVENFQEVMDLLAPDRELPMSELVIKVAKHFLGTPYVAGTLEIEPERLTINTRETDCILFVEMCLAMSLTAKDAEPTFEKYVDNLRRLRYRNGKVDGYASRLHYTTEWIRQGIENGLFEDITPSLGGVADTRPINFMSTHPDSYAPLKGESPYARDNRARIAAMEERVSAMPRCYLPKERIAAVEDRIQDGDILCFATSVGGLDYSHVVIAYRAKKGGRLGFIHASTSAMKVIVEPRTLEEYLQARKSATGVTVLRVKD